jgi:hypothetical protein
VEEERGAGVEAHAEAAEEGTRWGGGGGHGGGHAVEGGRGGGAGIDRCGEMTGLGFGGSSALKTKNSCDGR